ncbi:MAG: RHS repeat-associated core domain-containing protein, partial [Patescibacteria group bacterium]
EPNGFYYMRARYYDPEVRRFISEDPIGFNGGDLNLYAYVGNNPTMFVDPTGLDRISFWLGVADHYASYVGLAGGPYGKILSGATTGACLLYSSYQFGIGEKSEKEFVYDFTKTVANQIPFVGPAVVTPIDTIDTIKDGLETFTNHQQINKVGDLYYIDVGPPQITSLYFDSRVFGKLF